MEDLTGETPEWTGEALGGTRGQPGDTWLQPPDDATLMEPWGFPYLKGYGEYHMCKK
jgi:hypothetical protein